MMMGCGAINSGIVGHGETGSAPPEMGAAGLTLTEEELLRRGPGLLTATAAAELMPSYPTHWLRMDLKPLVRSGLAGVLLDMMPSEGRSRYDGLTSSTGLDPLVHIGAVQFWTVEREQESRAVIIGHEATGQELVLWARALTRELSEALSGDTSPATSHEQVVVVAPVPAVERDAVVQLLSQEIESAERLDLGSAVSVLAGTDRLGRLRYAYVWPDGVILGTLRTYRGERMKAGARAAFDAVQRIERAVSAAAGARSPLTTVSLRLTVEDMSHSLAADVNGTVEMTYEAPIEAFGEPERVQPLVEGWEEFRELMVAGVTSNPFFQSRSALRLMIVEALTNADVSETSDGVRVRTEVDTGTLVEGLRELPDP